MTVSNADRVQLDVDRADLIGRRDVAGRAGTTTVLAPYFERLQPAAPRKQKRVPRPPAAEGGHTLP
jgi:hypothetical protein